MMATMRIAQLQRAWRATSCLERLLCSTPAACGAHAALELSQPWGKARSRNFIFKNLTIYCVGECVGWLAGCIQCGRLHCLGIEEL